MPLNRPTLATLVNRISGDFRARMQATGPILRKTVIKIVSFVNAGMAHLLYGYIDQKAKNFFPQDCDEANLLRWGTLKKLPRTPATFAEFDILCTGVNDSVIDTTKILKRSDGAEYQVQANATVVGGEASVSVKALLPGAEFNVEVETILTFTTPVEGVDPTGEVTGITNEAEDIEPLEAYRTRIIDFFQAPSHGGNDDDYIRWAKEVPGVTRAWVDRHVNGPGTVGLKFVRDNDVDIIPDSGEIDEVKEYIEDRMPSHVWELDVYAPEVEEIDIEIANLNPDTPAVRTAIEAELRDLISREGNPEGTVLLSHIKETISTSAGEVDHQLVSPIADVPMNDKIGKLGTVTYS